MQLHDGHIPTTIAAHALAERLGRRSIVLIGMMGAGKTTIGRRLARRLRIPFIDADTEIERAAGQSVADIFAERGETFFRTGEQKVIARILAEGPQVLATGGGAFMNAQTREAIRQAGISIWLKADFDTLMRRVRRRSNRPLLKTDDPDAVMRDLIEKRYPVYGGADITIQTREIPQDVIIGEVVAALADYLGLPADND